MSTKADTSLRLSRMIQADPRTVFGAWTEPEQMKRWACPEGLTVADVQADLRVGGKYMIRMEGADGQVHTAVGVYRQVERPRRLVYTWDWLEEGQSMGETLVTVDFNDLDGATEVVLTHELFPGAEAKQGHEEGWTSCLNRLEKLYAE